MMKKLLLAATFGLFAALVSVPAMAACPGILQLKDNIGTTANAKYTDDGSGNCQANVVDSTVVTNTSTTNTDLGAPGATACSTDTGSCSHNQLLQRIAQRITSLITALGSPFQAGGSIGNTGFNALQGSAANSATNPFFAVVTSQYPTGATATNGSATGTTAATSTTLPATSSVTEYACWISIRANATATSSANATLSDGTKTFNFLQWTAPAASGVGIVEEVFNPCVPASTTNLAWTLTSAAPGSGGIVSVSIGGYTK